VTVVIVSVYGCCVVDDDAKRRKLGDDPGTACPGAVFGRERSGQGLRKGSVLSVPDLKEAVPRSRGYGRAILCHAKTAHTIVMAC